jgi:hypothetical protein
MIKPGRFLLAAIALATFAPLAAAQPVTTHPRLWITTADIPRLRSWAVPTNPVFQSGLLLLANQAKADMDAGLVPGPDATNGGPTYVSYAAEQYAELFAFMSIIDNDPVARADYAQRARTLLMYVMDRAVLGASPGQPYRDPAFSISDRSRWHGEAFGLTVDWIYDSLSPADKAEILTVFLRWCDEDKVANVTTDNHPVPVDVVNDPILVSDPTRVRWSGNNYYAAHMRNMAFMALSFDLADDPGGILSSGFLGNATGAWLYVMDYLTRNDARGGLMPEGFEYSPQTIAYMVQVLLALRTAGQDDPGTWGPQVVLPTNPFWTDLPGAYLGSLSPTTQVPLPPNDYLGPVYLPAWFGAGQNYWAENTVEAFGALGAYDYLAGNAARLDAIRWIEINTPPGGAASLLDRIRNPSEYFQRSILSFLIFDPGAATAPDPRPALPLRQHVPGLDRILARTDWGPNANWIFYALSWNEIDHQSADGNAFGFWRNGEWLTKQRIGYDLDYLASNNHNTLLLRNDQPPQGPGDYRYDYWLKGSQWAYNAAANPALLGRSFGAGFVYALGDSTNLYNYANENLVDILHASRSIVWVEPDHLVIYDRAESQTAGRFKQFVLNLPGLPAVNGAVSTIATPGNQRLFITTVLPAGAVPAPETSPNEPSGMPANNETMGFRLRVAAPGDPTIARFLHVLQGADAAGAADPVTYVQGSSGTPFEGALVAGSLALFPVDLATPFTGLGYTVPACTLVHRVTGLGAGAGYTITRTPAGPDVQIAIAAGGATKADEGGVLAFGSVAGLVITAPSCVQANEAGIVASVPSTPGSTYQWIIAGGTITAGQGTSQITFTAGSAGTVTLQVVETPSSGCPRASDAVEIGIGGSCCTDLSQVTITATPPETVCTLCTGGTASVTDTGGGAVTHQWGYRTTTGGPITDLPGETGSTYLIKGSSFPGAGPYLLVETTTPTCGPTLTSNEIPITVVAPLATTDLVHGTGRIADLAPPPPNGVDWYLLRQSPRSSWEVVVDGVTGDVGSASGPALERVAGDGSTVLQAGTGSGSSKSLRIRNDGPAAVADYVRVTGDCGAACGAGDEYRIRAYETTARIARFNNSATQVTVLVLRNESPLTMGGTLWFWKGSDGSVAGSQAFTLPPRGSLAVNTASIAPGASGSVTVTHDGRYGELAGKAVAVEPATGFTFDTPLETRPR